MVGSAELPLEASSQLLEKTPAYVKVPKPVHIPLGKGIKGKIAVNDIIFKVSIEQTSGSLGSAKIGRS